MGSLKLRLVVSAVILSLVPLAAAAWALGATEIGGLQPRLLWAVLGSAGIAAAAALLAGGAMVSALHELAGAAAEIAQGRLSSRVQIRGRGELAQLGCAFNEMAKRLQLRQEELAAERARVRRGVAQVGVALAAMNEADALLPVIVECTMDATGAAGARILEGRVELLRVGKPEAGGDPCLIALGAGESGRPLTLVLYPVCGTAFGEDAFGAAASLAGQAAGALENARLYALVRRQAVTDPLTDLANRRRFEDALALEVCRVRRFGGSLSVVVADLDAFKQVNDRHGHRIGDAVLRLFAAVIRETVREIDLPARPGGEEFAVILPGTDLPDAVTVAEQLRLRLAEQLVRAPNGGCVTVTASFGVAAYAPPLSPAELLAAADEALCRAKVGGKNRVEAAATIA